MSRFKVSGTYFGPDEPVGPCAVLSTGVHGVVQSILQIRPRSSLEKPAPAGWTRCSTMRDGGNGVSGNGVRTLYAVETGSRKRGQDSLRQGGNRV